MKTSITSVVPGSTSYSSPNFGSSSSCPSSLCLLYFTKPLLPCPVPVPCSRSCVCVPIVFSVPMHCCSCVCVPIASSCSRVLIPCLCIVPAISSHSFSWTRALCPSPRSTHHVSHLCMAMVFPLHLRGTNAVLPLHHLGHPRLAKRVVRYST